MSTRARKGSGGVAILVKDSLLSDHGVTLIDKECEGILGIELKNKMSGFTIQIFACYLPPIDSPYSNTATFFGHLITKLYVNNHVDMFVLAGDFNARIGCKQDIIEQIDSIPK